MNFKEEQVGVAWVTLLCWRNMTLWAGGSLWQCSDSISTSFSALTDRLVRSSCNQMAVIGDDFGSLILEAGWVTWQSHWGSNFERQSGNSFLTWGRNLIDIWQCLLFWWELMTGWMTPTGFCEVSTSFDWLLGPCKEHDDHPDHPMNEVLGQLKCLSEMEHKMG